MEWMSARLQVGERHVHVVTENGPVQSSLEVRGETVANTLGNEEKWVMQKQYKTMVELLRFALNDRKTVYGKRFGSDVLMVIVRYGEIVRIRWKKQDVRAVVMTNEGVSAWEAM